jgi:hypothetical protein
MCRTTWAIPNCGCPAYPVAPWLLLCDRAVKNAKAVEYTSPEVVIYRSNPNTVEDASKCKKWKCLFPDSKENPKLRYTVTNCPCDMCRDLDREADEDRRRDLSRQVLMVRGKTDLVARAGRRFENVATIEPVLQFQREKQSLRVMDNLKKKYGFKQASKNRPGTDGKTFVKKMATLHEEAVALREKLYEREGDQAQAEREARTAELEKDMEKAVAKLGDELQKRQCRLM